MARQEQAIFTNLCMVTDGHGNVLVEDRVDADWPGICFPGGHVEPGESFTQSVIREVREETGLTIEDPTLCGIKQFPTKTGARYVVFLYTASQFSGTLKSSEEGEVYWVPRQSLFDRPVVEDFADMVRVMESDKLSEFQYVKKDGSWQINLF